MPHAAQTKAEAARNPPDEVSPPPQPLKPEPQPPETVRKPAAKGAPFPRPGGRGRRRDGRLQCRGRDAVHGFRGRRHAGSADPGGDAPDVRRTGTTVRRGWSGGSDALEQRFDALEQRFDAQERKLDALTAEVQRVNEVVDVKLDGIRREIRLIWGALGISLTVWLVILGYLLTN